jgi:hypothetical protein
VVANAATMAAQIRMFLIFRILATSPFFPMVSPAGGDGFAAGGGSGTMAIIGAGIGSDSAEDQMPKVAFEYRDFWDIPRLIVCTVEGTEILLDSEFDDLLEEYAPHYKVYALPPELDSDSTESWADLPPSQAAYLGSVPVSEIEFDPSKRKEIEVGPLLKFLKR